MTTETNTCVKCGLTKPVDEFVKGKKMPRGIENRCKQCKREASRKHYNIIRQIPERIERLRIQKRAVLKKYRENLADDKREQFRIKSLETNSRQRWADPKIARLLNLCAIVLKDGEECLVVLTNGDNHCNVFATDKRWWPGKALRPNWISSKRKNPPKGVAVFGIYKRLGGELATRSIMTCPLLYRCIKSRADFLIEQKRKHGWQEFPLRDRRGKKGTTRKSENK
jgi:hypothetical protein